MADNSSTNGNSWTILAPEVKESGVESMSLLSEGQGELHAQSSAQSDTPTEQTHLPDSPQVTPLESSDDAAVLHSKVGKEDAASSVHAHVETLTSLTLDPGEQGASGDSSASQPFIEPESFSDSYTHISPAPVSTSLLEASEEEEEEEGLSHEEDKGELRKTLREECKPEETLNQDDGLRRRNVSVLTPLHHRDEEEEEEEGEEEQFRHPQREGDGDIGFTLNKCIFGALILLGLGTIFFSEGDVDTKNAKYPEVKKEWLNPDADIPVGVQSPEILDKLAKENQQITSLKAQLEEQEVELKAAQLQVEEGTRKRLKMEELEAENQRIRGELDKLPALQKEYEQESERVKRETERVNKELEALPAMQKELEHLRDKVTELTQSTANVQAVTPSAGHKEAPKSQERKERKDKKALDKEKKVEDRRTEKKEWKKDKIAKVDEQVGKGKRIKGDKELEKEDDGHGKRKGEGKNKQKYHKQEHAQRWELDDEKRFKEKSGKKEWKEDKKWDREKHGEFVARKYEKREKGKEGKEWKQKSDQKDRKEEKEWKRGKEASRNDKEWRDKSEKKKDWKERKDWAGEKENRASRDEQYSEKRQKEKSRKGKKDYLNENSERKEKEAKRGGKETDKAKSGEITEKWKEDKKYKNKNLKIEEKMNRKGKNEASHHSYSDQKHSKDHVHAKYWAEQREKILHYYGSTEGCADVTACAHVEGLAPVSQPDFEAFISDYLTKLQGHENQTSRKEELGKLMGEFFTDGVFVHDQIPFSEFVEDVADILEDMADDDDDDDDEDKNDEDDLEDEMKAFASEAMKKFALLGKEGNENKKEESVRKRMKG